ncbi:MAG: helix-turn-helix domain-containing protein [Candidatus Margulisbacteria bacterium]|jgi:transcriptional regulator with XRE-family HTH domain|nr:helix-turn-helix domain-containing protein [Candidatus Margulisiibacteriota bacterium]
MKLNIGKNIKSFRKIAGLTQEKLADKAGLTLRYFQHIESGVGIPAIPTLIKIAQALNKNIKDFF